MGPGEGGDTRSDYCSREQPDEPTTREGRSHLPLWKPYVLTEETFGGQQCSPSPRVLAIPNPHGVEPNWDAHKRKRL